MTSPPDQQFLGHETAQRMFIQSFRKASLHHAWILAGPRGIGKAGFAKQATRFLLDSGDIAANSDNGFASDGSSHAAKFLAAGSHPDFRLLERRGKTDKEEKKAREEGIGALEEHEKKRNISITQVRSLQSLFATRSSISNYRVVVIDAIDDLERSAANALLKSLEEPPENTVFLLVSHAPERLLPTIRSRCQILRFDSLNDQQMRQALTRAAPSIEEAEINVLIKAGEGSPGRALQYIDAGLAELEDLALDILKTGDRDNSIRTDLARKLSLKAATPRYHAFLTRAPSLIAEHVRSIDSTGCMQAIDIWQEARDLAAMAVPKALDNQAVILRLAGLMGSLAQHDKAA